MEYQAKIMKPFEKTEIVLDDYDYDEKGNPVRQYKNMDYSVEFEELSIECAIIIKESFRVIGATYSNPPESWTVDAENIWIDNFKVFNEGVEVNNESLRAKAYFLFLDSIELV